MLDQLLSFLNSLTRRIFPGRSCLLCDAVAIPDNDVCPECVLVATEMVYWRTDSLDPFADMSEEEFQAVIGIKEAT